jgi:hypothetical protein
MSLVGQSRHFDSALRTSALLRSADTADWVRQVRKVPNSDMPIQHYAAQLDLLTMQSIVRREVLVASGVRLRGR